MSGFLTIAAVAALLPLSQAPANRAPIIDWQQVAAPLGGNAEVVLPHGDVLLARSIAHSLNRWWLSSDHGATWQIAAGQLGEAWWVMPHGADVFIISRSGGVQRTSDLGRSWIPCGRVAAHRENQGRLLPAGRSLLYWIHKVGLFRSGDRCATWTPVQVPWNLDDWGLWSVLAPDAGVLLVHSSHNWFRSTDEGQSWQVVSGPGGAPLPPAASSGRPSFVFGTDLVLGTTNGLFRSTDRGLSWSPMGFQGQWTRATTTPDGAIYVALQGTDESTRRTRIMRSTDGRKTWLPADDGLRGHHLRDLKRDATGTVYAAGDAGLYRLEATGRWQHVGFPTFFPSSLFAAPWGDLYLGADYGDAYRSRDRGVTWQPLLLPEGYKHAASITATARGDLLMATSTALLRSRDRGDTWEAVQAENLEAENEILTLFTVPSTGTIVGGRRDGVIRSDHGGQTWATDPAGGSERATTFAERGNGELIVGSADGALFRLPGTKEAFWPLPPHDGTAVRCLAVLPNGQVLVGTTSGLLRLKPTGDKWEAVPLPREEEPDVTALIVGPRGHLVVATSAGGVLISNDEGRTWWPANQGLATQHVRTMALGADGELYIATGTDGVDYGDSAPGGRLRVYRARVSDR